MDAGQSPQTGILAARDFASPTKGTRTRTVREYEQTISELNKENFELKLKLYMVNEAMKKNSGKDKDVPFPSEDPVEVFVKLKSETEALSNELINKDKLLQDAIEKAEKYETEFRELEKKCEELQSQLSSLSELPSKEEYLSLLSEKENLIKYTESLEKDLSEKQEEIHDVNQKIEILANQNEILEQKVQKRNLALQSFVYKSYKEKEMLPDELRNVVISATQAVKNKNKEELAIAEKCISATLCKMMSSVQTLNKSAEKENIESSQVKCLKEEFLEKSSSFLPNQNDSYTELSQIQSLKEVLGERNIPETKYSSSLDSSVHESFVKAKTLNESAVNIAERDVIDYFNVSAAPSVTSENLISFSNRHSSQSVSISEHNLTNIETVSMLPVSSDLIPEKDLSKSDVNTFLNRSSEQPYQLIDIMKENEKLKHAVKEKLSIIQDLQATCKELELKSIHLKGANVDAVHKENEELKLEIKEKASIIQDLQATYKEVELKRVHLKESHNDALDASEQSVHTQTDITGCNLVNEYEKIKLQKDAKLSNSVEELREDVLRLLLAIEDKNNELSDVKQSLLDVQEDLKKALSTSSVLDKDYYINERNELRERLALSCSVNKELLKHLKKLESFMENLLENKFNNSIESMSEKSDFISMCLNESLKLSRVLSDHLSICEGSKLFEDCESLLYKNESYSDERSLPHLNLSQLSMPEQHFTSFSRTRIHEDFIPFIRKNDHKMNKESGDNQLCWHCWQQLNPPMKSETFHQIENNIVHKNIGYPSSESDIWSEPDRNISMQRIGISLQNSPVSSKSPRKLRLKEKRMSNRLSSDQNTSSSESQRLSKKRQGSASRRLFSKENIKNQDFTSEKFYLLLTEKYSKLKSLLDKLENVKDGNVTIEVWGRLNAVMASLGEALQKLQIAKENAKNFPSAICGKCVMLELFADLKASHKESDFNIDDSTSFEQELLQQFLGEIHLLKEACKESFSLFSEIIDKRSQPTQSDSLSENESIKINELEDAIVDLNGKNEELSKNLADVKRLLNMEKEVSKSVKVENLKLIDQINDFKKGLSNMKQKEKELHLRNKELVEEITKVNQNNFELNNNLKELKEKRKESTIALDKLTQSDSFSENKNIRINELENVIVDLNSKNKKLGEDLDDVKRMLYMEKEVLESVKVENLNLISQINGLKEELSNIKQKEKELHQKNEELAEELANVNQNNFELSNSLKELEEKRKESDIVLNQLTAELQRNKLNLIDMNKKCLAYQNELNEQFSKKEECENKFKSLECVSLNEKKKYLRQINDLNAEKNNYLKELEIIQEKKLALENENVILNNNLNSKNNELDSSKKAIQILQEAKEILNANCIKLQGELGNAKECIANLQKKCSSYEDEVLTKCKENEEEYCQKLKQLEVKSSGEKQRLMSEVSVLRSEREDIIQKLKNEKECYERLMKEKIELNRNYADSCQQISSLKLLNEELKNKQLNLIQKNDFFEKALHSSNSECNSLNQELKHLRETLQNLESKCLTYEKELIAAAGMKDTLVECLVKIANEFSSHRRKINEICKAYENEDGVLQDETSEFIPVIDEDNVQNLSENVTCECRRLLESVDMLVMKMKNIQSKSSEIKTPEEKHKTSIKKQAEFHKAEIKNLKSQNDNLQQVIDEIQKSISEKEKSVHFSAYEIQSLKEKLQNRENEIERGNQLLKRKDDEITLLQERIFNLQTGLNNIMANKLEMFDKTTSFDNKYIESTVESASPDNQLPSQPLLKVPKMCQTSEVEDFGHLDDTFSSTSTLDGSKSSCCEKYWKKCYSLQTKLALRKKHIEILEKEKNDLRESILQHLQDKQDSSEKRNSLNKKLTELESVLAQKKAFINELKGELLKTCNSLIDKEKELDDLKEKFSDYEKKYKDVTSDIHDKHSILTNTVDTNIKTLKNYKWQLIQTIFDIQKKFYEKKGIHLNYFEKFKDHVSNLYSLQLTQSFSKSESMPLLGTHATKLRDDQNDKLKNLVGLELDIECLENLKIFLDRFFVPCVLQTSQTGLKSTELEEERKKISSDKLTLQAEVESSKLQRSDASDKSFPDVFTSRVLFEHKDLSQEKSISFENFASNVSYYLDCIENFFTAVRKCQWLEVFDVSSKECIDKAEARSLLLKIFQEVKVLHETSNKLFDLNLLLKNFDFIITNRPDISDRESLLSEETIAVSRTESPLSFEDVNHTKLPSPEVLKLEEKSLKPQSLGNRLGVVESYSTKGTAGITGTIGSSCDSICQRSHYSSPDLGIESDPNHDSSAPEQKEDGINKYQRHILEEQKSIVKIQQKSAFTNIESAGRWSGHKFGETLYAIGNLQSYELLKKEVKESLIAIKSVLSRTGDGLHHVAKYTSPRKTLEYNTLKSIKYTCEHIEVCLKTANDLVGKFWTAPCPSEREWKLLNDENQSLCEKLTNLKAMIQKQESEFKKAMGKLENAQVMKATMEKKISKKLVKTKKVIRQAELKLLENRCQNFPPVPKYPSDEAEKSAQANLVQQM